MAQKTRKHVDTQSLVLYHTAQKMTLLTNKYKTAHLHPPNNI